MSFIQPLWIKGVIGEHPMIQPRVIKDRKQLGTFVIIHARKADHVMEEIMYSFQTPLRRYQMSENIDSK